MISRKRRALQGAAAGVVTLAIVATLVPDVRTRILIAAGRALVASDPIGPADVIVVPKWAGEAGALEAAELNRNGVSPRVAILVGPQTASSEQLIHRGIISPSEDWITRLIRTLGVTVVEEIPNVVNGTEAEGEILPDWCDRHHFRTVAVVTTSDHSRRVRRILRRTLKGRGVRIVIVPARYSDFDPDRWWETRNGVRTEVVEAEKLLFDIITHPFS